MTSAQLPGAGLRVALFATCFNDTMWPETPKAVVRLLERLGCRVEFPAAQTCCGQMLTNTGYAGDALPLVRRFVDVFGSYDAVVAPSGSCVGSVRHQHASVARDAGDAGLAAEVEQVSTRVHELSELLVDVLGVTDVGAYFPHRVTYHPTCHSLRMLRVGDRPLRLLRAVEGIDLVELPGAEEVRAPSSSCWSRSVERVLGRLRAQASSGVRACTSPWAIPATAARSSSSVGR